MPENNEEVVFILTKEDVVSCAEELGIAEEAITDDVLHRVKKGVEFGFEFWPEVVKSALQEATDATTVKKP